MLLALMMTAAATTGDVQTLARGSLSGIEHPREAIVRTEAEWRALWAAHAPGEAIPSVDFTHRTVLAVFLGSRSTAGFKVEIASVERAAADATVRYREVRPGPDQMLAQMVTAPFHIVHVPRIDGPVRFVKNARD